MPPFGSRVCGTLGVTGGLLVCKMALHPATCNEAADESGKQGLIMPMYLTGCGDSGRDPTFPQRANALVFRI